MSVGLFFALFGALFALFVIVALFLFILFEQDDRSQSSESQPTPITPDERLRKEEEERHRQAEEKKRREEERAEEDRRENQEERNRSHKAPNASKGNEERYAQVLGLQGRTTREDIKRCYRELVVQYHPDRVNHLGPRLKEVAEEEMKLINEAYDYFRRKYDIQ